MRKVMTILILLAFAFSVNAFGEGEETVIFGFESGMQGWEIPDWAYEKPDHVQQEIEVAEGISSEGDQSLLMATDFPGGRWTGAIGEIMQYFDWTDYGTLACDIYIPEDAPVGLKAKIILTVGDNWKWVEMSRSYILQPGEWITVSADLKAGSIDWRRVQVDDTFRSDIRKIDIRVESNNKPAYTGPLYIDNIRVIE